MNYNKYTALLFLAICCLIFIGCKTSGHSLALKNELTNIEIEEKHDAISYRSLASQQIPTFLERSSLSRGVFTPVVGSAVSLATNAIKKMIAKDRAKYVANYSFALTDLFFYDQLSAESVFDPVGMQFNGFTLIRTFINSQNQTDTAFIAKFELDISATNEIINNSVFRLKLADFQLFYSKIKMTKAQKNNINMDIEITFNTSYVNELGQLFDNVELGKFYFLLREAPMDKKDPNYSGFYENLQNSRIDGRSFIVPRSFGYYKNAKGDIAKSYSQGAYSISAKVTESANDRFVTKIISDNSNQIIEMIGKGAKSALVK